MLNRTGRMFTGDRSGDFLYKSLHRAGFASQPESVHREDGLELHGAWITAAAHCAPPDNEPAPAELAACRPYLERETQLLPDLRLVVALGRIAFETWLSILKDRGAIARRADYTFGHGKLYNLNPALLCSYHPSQQILQPAG